MEDTHKCEEEADDEYLSVLSLSNKEAIRDLELIWQSLLVLKSQTSRRRAHLAKELAENKLRKELEMNKKLSESLDGALRELAIRDSQCSVKQSEIKDNIRLEESSDSDTLLDFSLKGEDVSTTAMEPKAMHQKQVEVDAVASQLKRAANICSIDGKTFGDRHRELLILCQKIMRPYGIPMYEFSTSWSTGHAFCAFIHFYRPDLIDEKYLKWKNPEQTLRYVEGVAKSLGAHFDGNFVKLLRRKRPGFVKVYYFVFKLYTCLGAAARSRSTPSKVSK